MNAQAENKAADDAPQWLLHKERGNLFWLRVMRWISLTMGRRRSRIVLYGIALYYVLAVPAARKSSREYLERCLDRPVGWLDLYRHILAFSSTTHDRVYLLNDRHDLFDIRLFGVESLHAMHADKRGFFLFGAHLGSFEVLRILARSQPNLKVCVAMYPENARQVNNALAAINPGVMQDIVSLGQIDSMLAIHQRLKDGAMVGILADRAIGQDQYQSLPFLGSPARFPTGPFRMAAMLKQPVYFMAGLYRGGNHYDVHFELLADFSIPDPNGRDAAVREVLAKYVAALERHCKSAPYNWFNFYDFWESTCND